VFMNVAVWKCCALENQIAKFTTVTPLLLLASCNVDYHYQLFV
jgi:hypothetical protein